MSLGTKQPEAGDDRFRDIEVEKLYEMWGVDSVPDDPRELMKESREVVTSQHLGRSALRGERFIPGNYLG